MLKALVIPAIAKQIKRIENISYLNRLSIIGISSEYASVPKKNRLTVQMERLPEDVLLA